MGEAAATHRQENGEVSEDGVGGSTVSPLYFSQNLLPSVPEVYMNERPHSQIPLTALLNRVRCGVFGTDEWLGLVEEFLVFRKVPEEFASVLAEHLRAIEVPTDVERMQTIALTVLELNLDRGRARLQLADACLHVIEVLPEHHHWEGCTVLFLQRAGELAGVLILDELVRLGNKAITPSRRLHLLIALQRVIRLAFQARVGLPEMSTRSIENWIELALHESGTMSKDQKASGVSVRIGVAGAVILAFLRPQTFLHWWRALSQPVREALLPGVVLELEHIIQVRSDVPSHEAQRFEVERSLATLSALLTPS